MRNRKQISIGIILFIVFNTFFTAILISFNDFQILDIKDADKEKISHNPRLAEAMELKYDDIIRTDDIIYRLFESVNFTINTFDYGNVNRTVMQIDFSNGSTINYNMKNFTLNKYSYKYTPEFNAPLGFQNVSFLIYDITGTLLNTHTTYTNFTVISNYLAYINSSEYYVGDSLYADFLVNNCSRWNLTIVDSTIESEQINITNFEYNSNHIFYRFTNETFYNLLDQTLYIKLNMTNTDFGLKRAAYFPFKIINTNPIINISSITFSIEELYRDEECKITLNVTDTEDRSKDLDVSISIEDPQGTLISTISLDYDFNNTFSGEFSIPASSQVGKYRIEITAEDNFSGIDSHLVFLSVKNNLPEIHSYKINGRSMEQGLSIPYGKDLVFSINVSDVENVAYVKVALLDENNEWFNITREYKGVDTEITIRTIDLITGVWYVYIYVIDSDGAITSLTDDYDKAPQAITIIPDALSGYIPWIVFFLGLTFGILISIGLAYRHYKSKAIDLKGITSKKKEAPSKKPKVKKIEKEPETELLLDEKESIEKTLEKEEGSVPKRKIKRKL